jgi:hypothetical protein
MADKNKLENNSKYYCYTCGLECNFRSIYEKHIKSPRHISLLSLGGVENKKKYRCDKCDVSFLFKSMFLTHLKSKKHKKIHSINADNETILKDELGESINETNIEHKDNYFHIEDIQNIENIETEFKVHYCNECSFSSIYKHCLQNHVLNNHSNIEERKKSFPFYCPNCDVGAFSNENFKRHLYSKKHIRITK